MVLTYLIIKVDSVHEHRRKFALFATATETSRRSEEINFCGLVKFSV